MFSSFSNTSIDAGRDMEYSRLRERQKEFERSVKEREARDAASQREKKAFDQMYSKSKR